MMRRKFAVIGGCYFSGLIFASVFHSYKLIISIAVIICIAVGVSLLFLHKGSAAFAVFPFAAAVCAYFSSYSALYDSTEAFASSGEYIITDAVINEKHETGGDLAFYVLDGEVDGKAVRFLLCAEDTDMGAGGKMSFKASFSRLVNSSLFGSADYYRSKSVALQAHLCSEITFESEGVMKPITDYRRYIGERTDIAYPESAALIKGIFMGDRSSFTDYDDYIGKASGTAHLTAVSGTHLTLIASILTALLAFLKAGPRVKLAVTVFVTVCFMVFFGMTASVVRSGIMVICANTGEAFFRKSDCLNSVGLSVLLITLVNPFACHDGGLALSAVTTIGAGVIAPKLSRDILSRLPKTNRELCELICVSICAPLAGMPLSLIYFDTFSLVGAVATVIATPFCTVCLFSALAYALTGGAFDFLLFPAHLCCEAMEQIFEISAFLPFSHFECNGVLSLIVILAVAVSFAALYMFLKKRHIYAIFTAACLTFTVLITALSVSAASGAVTILPISDGDNSATVILSDKLNAAVINGDSEKCARAVYMNIMSRNIRRLDFVVICGNGKITATYLNRWFSDLTDTVICSDSLCAQINRGGSFNGSCEASYRYDDGGISVYADSDGLMLDAYGVPVNISDNSHYKANYLNILKGNAKKSFGLGLPVYVTGRYTGNMPPGAVSLYYAKCEITIKKDGSIFQKTDYK